MRILLNSAGFFNYKFPLLDRNFLCNSVHCNSQINKSIGSFFLIPFKKNNIAKLFSNITLNIYGL